MATDAEKGARIAELIKKQQAGKITPAELDELKKLLAGASDAMKKDPLAGLPPPSKADYDAALAKASAAATARGDTIPPGTKGIARPTGPAPEGQTWVQGPTGWVLAPIAKPEDMKINPALMPALGLKPDAQGNPVPDVKPEGDSFSRSYTAMGEALEADYKDFANYLRGLADEGKLVGADGKPLPMYSKEKLAGMTLPELKKLAADNPLYAKGFFKAPSAETAARLEGTGRTGIGPRSGMVEIPEGSPAPAPAATAAPKPAAAPAPAAPKPEEIVPTEATMAGKVISPEELPKATDSKKKFGEVLKDLAIKYGVPILEIIQAVGYQRGGIDKPTLLDQKYQEKLAQQERDWAKKLEDERVAREESTYQRRITEQRAWEAQQAELNRLADKEARGEELTAREKIARMQLEASRAARGTAGTASIIPE